MKFKKLNKPMLICLLLVFSLVFVFAIFWFCWEPFYIPSSSMQPTLLIGDLVWVHKTINKNNLAAGDVVVFKSADDDVLYIKRIVAKARDRIRIFGTQLFVNDVLVAHRPQFFEKRATRTSCEVLLKPASEEIHSNTPLQLPYVQSYKNFLYFEEELNDKKHWVQFDTKITPKDDEEWLVPENAFFVLGDNRTNSIDSRQHGFVFAKDVIGKADSIWFSVTSKLYACGEQRFGWFNLYLRTTRGGIQL